MSVTKLELSVPYLTKVQHCCQSDGGSFPSVFFCLRDVCLKTMMVFATITSVLTG